MFRSSTHLIDIPSLDRLVTYLENRDDRRQQREVDAMRDQVHALVVRLTQSNAALRAKIQENQQNAS